jgi:Fe-S-cluster-containing dehydrogenase component
MADAIRCALAAKDEHVGNDFPGYSAPHAALGNSVIKIRGSGGMVDAAYLPTKCNHCDRAPCLKAGADGSVRKRADGIVIIDPVKAKGRRNLVEACPYGAIVWNEEQQLPQTWIFDAHLLDQGWSASAMRASVSHPRDRGCEDFRRRHGAPGRSSSLFSNRSSMPVRACTTEIFTAIRTALWEGRYRLRSMAAANVSRARP